MSSLPVIWCFGCMVVARAVCAEAAFALAAEHTRTTSHVTAVAA